MELMVLSLMNAFMVTLTFVYTSHQHFIMKLSGIRARKMLQILKKQFPILIGIKLFKTFQQIEKLNF